MEVRNLIPFFLFFWKKGSSRNARQLDPIKKEIETKESELSRVATGSHILEKTQKIQSDNDCLHN